MSWAFLVSQGAASVRASGVLLDDARRAYLAGVGLDLLSAALLVWAAAGVKSWPWRLSLALGLFGCLHVFGGWEREPKELAFSLTVLFCVLSLGAHVRALAACEERQRSTLRSASWAQ